MVEILIASLVLYSLGGLLTVVILASMPIVFDRAWLAILVVFACWPLVLWSFLTEDRR